MGLLLNPSRLWPHPAGLTCARIRLATTMVCATPPKIHAPAIGVGLGRTVVALTRALGKIAMARANATSPLELAPAPMVGEEIRAAFLLMTVQAMIVPAEAPAHRDGVRAREATLAPPAMLLLMLAWAKRATTREHALVARAPV